MSREIFTRHGGGSKLTKESRNLHVRYLAHGIKTPDEVWYVRESGAEKLYYLARMQASRETVGIQAVFQWDGSGWVPVTGYQGRDEFDLASTRAPERTPILIEHDRRQRCGVGQLSIATDGIRIAGTLLDNEHGDGAALLYMFDLGTAGKKLVVRINYRTRREGVTNMVGTGRVLDAKALATIRAEKGHDAPVRGDGAVRLRGRRLRRGL